MSYIRYRDKFESFESGCCINKWNIKVFSRLGFIKMVYIVRGG